MKNYKQRKDEARRSFIELQDIIANSFMSWGEAAELNEMIEKKAKRFGLVKEARENGLL